MSSVARRVRVVSAALLRPGAGAGHYSQAAQMPRELREAAMKPARAVRRGTRTKNELVKIGLLGFAYGYYTGWDAELCAVPPPPPGSGVLRKEAA